MNNKACSWREVLAQQWFMTKFCFRAMPGFMLYHCFESIKLQVSIFFEFNWCMNYILEVAEEGGSFRKILWCLGILMAAIAVSTATFAVYMQYAGPKARPAMYQAFRMEIYNKVKDLDLSCYDDQQFYEKFILAAGEADQCIERYISTLEILMGRSVSLVIQLFWCSYLNPALLLIMAATLPAELFLVLAENRKMVASRMERLPLEQKQEYENRVFYLSDYAKELRLNPEMKEKCRQDYQKSNDKVKEISRRYGKKLFAYESIHEAFLWRLVKEGGTWTFLLYQMLVLHDLSCAHLLTSRLIIGRVSYDSQSLIKAWRDASENSAYIAQIRELIGMEPTIHSEKNLPVPEEPGVISVEHISFAYVPEKPVLQDISLRIQPGEKIALAGYNGSGKTTLVKLLLRLYDPTSGRICMGGRDIRDYDVESYRHSIGSVFQNFRIYAASLRENVLMDVGEGTSEENYRVEKALHDAHFTLQDKRLVWQIETPLTAEFEKDGVNLSGGEAQKVAIARTLYQQQKIIIMDEPSSALDPLAEYQLNQELNEIARDRTVIYISHRLSTIRDADRIYMMENGRIIESGTHEELLAMKGKYADMWEVQAGLYTMQQDSGSV